MIGAATDDARAEPLKIGAGSRSVRLAFDVPGTVGREEFAEILFGVTANAGPAMRQVVRPQEHLEVFFGVNLRPGLEHDAVEAAFGEHLRGRTSASAGANDADVVLLGSADYLEHF